MLASTRFLAAVLLLSGFVSGVGCGRGSGPPAPAPPAVVDTLIGDFKASSANRYAWVRFQSGSLLYSDRDYFYVSVPPNLVDQVLLQTANNDKSVPAGERSFVSFTARQPLRVYIIYTDMRTQLAAEWLTESKGWRREPFALATTLAALKATRLVRSRFFGPGERVQLGGNGCEIENCDMYTVAIVPGR